MTYLKIFVLKQIGEELTLKQKELEMMSKQLTSLQEELNTIKEENGFGKTTLVALLKLYRNVISLSYRDMKKQFKLSKSTNLVDITVSFNKATAFDMVTKSIINLMEISPKFQRVRYERDMSDPSKNEDNKGTSFIIPQDPLFVKKKIRCKL